MDFDFIDFDTCEIAQEQKPYNIYHDNYDETTTEFYKVLREKKMNVFLQDDKTFEPEKAFVYNWQWDPYTGERIMHDPIGGLYFHPDDLIYYFYLKRLNGLWIEPKDETGGYYEGYYGDLLGGGEDGFIISRGTHPELYLFRLPIFDCYLHKEHDMSVITMGAKLTDDDVQKIDELANKYYKSKYKYGDKRPSLTLMKKYYDEAIKQRVDEDVNKHGVEELKHM